MYIAANIDDCAIVIKDFLPLDLFKNISNYKYSTSLINSHSEWQEELYTDGNKNVTMKKINIVNTIAILKNKKIESKNLIFKKFLKTIIDCPFIPYQKIMHLEAAYYEYEKHAGINWHDDGDYSLNYSFYIHPEWDNNWGGETLINTGRGLPLAVTPEPNSLIVIKNKIKHKVCSVTGPKKRKVLQVRGTFYK